MTSQKDWYQSEWKIHVDTPALTEQFRFLSPTRDSHRITHSREILVENFQTACIIHVGHLNNTFTLVRTFNRNHNGRIILMKYKTGWWQSSGKMEATKTNSDPVSFRKLLKVKYSSCFNAPYHTTAQVHSTKLQSDKLLHHHVTREV